MPPAPKRSPSPFLFLAVGLVLALGTCIGGPIGARAYQKSKVERFCRELKPGDPSADLEQRAREAGMQAISRPASKGAPSQVLAWAGIGFLRFFCTVEHDGAKVTSARTSFLD
jgi:hypothetical protein